MCIETKHNIKQHLHCKYILDIDLDGTIGTELTAWVSSHILWMKYLKIRGILFLKSL